MELEKKLKKLRKVLQDDFVCSIIVTDKEIKLAVVDLQKDLPETNEPSEEKPETNPKDFEQDNNLETKQSQLNSNINDINRGDGSFSTKPYYVI